MTYSLSLIIGLSERDELARQSSSSAQSANHDSWSSRNRVAFDSWGVSMIDSPWNATPPSTDATDPCEYSGWCDPMDL